VKRLTVQLDPEMLEVSNRLMQRTGMPTRVELIRRLLNFCDAQPDVIQPDMLGLLPESLRHPDFVRWYLSEVLTDPDPSADPRHRPVPPHSGPKVDTLTHVNPPGKQR